MENDIGKLLSQITKEYLSFNTEEATRQGIILPILSKLGWNIFNVREVVPEYSVGNGRIDYCLKIGEKNMVFIEVKKINEELDKHEKQILEYSFHHGVEMAVLTNGILWWLYLPLISGAWQQRKYLTIDIKQQETSLAAKHFREFLSRENIEKGMSLTRARALIESVEIINILNKTIPKAWHKLLDEPDDRFLDLFADSVESICGHRPDPQVLANFIQEQKELYGPTKGTMENKIKKPVKLEREPRKRGIQIKINNNIFKGSSVSDLYEQVLKYLYDNNYIESLKAYIPFATSGKRFLISREPYHPNGNKFWIPVEYKGYYMEAHKSYHNAIKSLEDLLKLCNLEIKK